ncbi:hypothetical protein ABZ297_12165 [Nonomuraea sp. NPDC005983]
MFVTPNELPDSAIVTGYPEYLLGHPSVVRTPPPEGDEVTDGDDPAE